MDGTPKEMGVQGRIRTVIADDEPPARRRIRSLLEKEADIEVIRECKNGLEAIAAVEAERPDLLFLDIQMPEADGFHVVKAIDPGQLPAIIFITAHDQFALKAFEVNALDYLLKPFDRARFQAALTRVRDQLRRRKGGELDPRIVGLLQELQPPRRRYLERLPVKASGRIHLVNVEDIDYVEAETNYARLHVGERSYLIRETMSGLEAKLDPDRFVRIHRSIIVRIDRVLEMEALFQGEYLIVLRDGTKLSSGRSYRAKLQEVFSL